MFMTGNTQWSLLNCGENKTQPYLLFLWPNVKQSKAAMISQEFENAAPFPVDCRQARLCTALKCVGCVRRACSDGTLHLVHRQGPWVMKGLLDLGGVEATLCGECVRLDLWESRVGAPACLTSLWVRLCSYAAAWLKLGFIDTCFYRLVFSMS